MKIGFFGAGKVGFSLGKYFSDNGLSVTGYYNRNKESALEAANFTGTKCFDSPEELINESDCIFLTVSDGAIKSVYDSIKSPMLSGKMLCHCSGSLSAEEAFPDIESFGACSCMKASGNFTRRISVSKAAITVHLSGQIFSKGSAIRSG